MMQLWEGNSKGNFFSVSISKLRWVKIQFLAKKLLETWACIIQLYREPIGLSMSWLVLKSERSEHLVFVLFTNQKPSASGFWFERRNDEARERITRGVSQAGFAEFASSVSTRSSYKERKGNALAPGDDEGRSNLRKAMGRRKQPSIRGYPNGETHRKVSHTESNRYGRGTAWTETSK